MKKVDAFVDWFFVVAIGTAAVGCVVLFAALLYGVGSSLLSGVEKHVTSPPAASDFSDRINHACRRGYEAYDWTVGDEFTPVPRGVVRVTCARFDPEGGPVDQYYVAVPR